MLDLPRIPLADWVNAAFRWIRSEYRAGFRAVSDQVEGFVEAVQDVLLSSEPVVAAVILILALVAGGWRLGLFAGLGLGLIHNLGLWSETMITLSLVLSAGLVCLVVGIPLGVATARSTAVERVARPVLDMMQTMPAFVYLIPAVSFFRLGVVAALFATVIFALPPMVRLTAHGIRQVDREYVEASDAFGATWWQTLVKVQLPLARPSILVGVNQTLMMSLSMVVISAMIGAGGLGGVVLYGITNVDAGIGFEGGLCIVILAVILDRITQGFGAVRAAGSPKSLLAGLRESARNTLRALVGSRRHVEEW